MASPNNPEKRRQSEPLFVEKECMTKPITEDEEETTVFPDGGWGWVITLCVFMTYVVIDGCVFSFGILYVQLLEYFNETGGRTAIIGAMLYGFPLIVAPFVCALVLHHGFRVVGLVGAIMIVFSFLLSIWAVSIEYLTVVLGVLGAFGMEMGYVSGVLCLSHYFEKYRGLATGLAMSGSGVGTFLFPPLLDQLLQNYAWEGTCLVLAGICLNLIPFSLSFFPLKRKQKRTRRSTEDLFESKDDQFKEDINRKLSRSATDLSPKNLCALEPKLHRSVPDLTEKYITLPILHIGNRTLSNSYHHGGYAMAFSGTSLQEEDDDDISDRDGCAYNLKHWLIVFSAQVITIFRSTVDRSLLADPCFLLFSFSNFLLCIYFGLTYLYIPHLVQMAGIDEQRASFLVSVIGMTTTVAQILLGFIGDKFKISVELYITCMILCGSSLIAMAFYPGDYIVVCFLCVVFGIGISGNYALTTLILIDLVGLHKLTVAFGMFQLQQGIASVLGTPIGGWIYDETGSYFWAFISGGICIVLSGVVLIPVPLVVNYRKKHRGRCEFIDVVVENFDTVQEEAIELKSTA